jgi:hypothetical protein
MARAATTPAPDPAGSMDMALGLRTMVIPTANEDSLYTYTGTDSRREWTVHLQVRCAASGSVCGACAGVRWCCSSLCMPHSVLASKRTSTPVCTSTHAHVHTGWRGAGGGQRA